jgi:hypothetical protein
MTCATGLEALEERARSELGMIKPGEIFLQVIERRQAGQRHRDGVATVGPRLPGR